MIAPQPESHASLRHPCGLWTRTRRLIQANAFRSPTPINRFQSALPRPAAAIACFLPQPIDNLQCYLGGASMASCPPSPAALTPNAQTAGTFTMVTCMSARSGFSRACRCTPRNGVGTWASIRSAVNRGQVMRQPSIRRGPASKPRGKITCLVAPRPTSTSIVASVLGRHGNTPCTMLACRYPHNRAVDGHAVSVAPRST